MKSNSKVYIVWCHKGEWDDYVIYIDKIFSTKIAAQKHKHNREKEIKELKENIQYVASLDVLEKRIYDDISYDNASTYRYTYEDDYPDILIHTVSITEETVYDN